MFHSNKLNISAAKLSLKVFVFNSLNYWVDFLWGKEKHFTCCNTGRGHFHCGNNSILWNLTEPKTDQQVSSRAQTWYGHSVCKNVLPTCKQTVCCSQLRGWGVEVHLSEQMVMMNHYVDYRLLWPICVEKPLQLQLF